MENLQKFVYLVTKKTSSLFLWLKLSCVQYIPELHYLPLHKRDVLAKRKTKLFAPQAKYALIFPN